MATSRKRAARSQLRIIGGEWRSRRLAFTPAEGLRPTTDRVRETLFNWLAPAIHGARCADLFTGSGALGLEALSRGAARCDFVDSSAAAVRQVQAHLDTLGAASRGHCHRRSALEFLAGCGDKFDIAFIDPPFGSGLVEPCCEVLASRQLLEKSAFIYIETAAQEVLPDLPQSWELYREKRAGGVTCRLFSAL